MPTDPALRVLDELRKALDSANELRAVEASLQSEGNPIGDPRSAAIVITTIEEAILRTQVIVIGTTLITGEAVTRVRDATPPAGAGG